MKFVRKVVHMARNTIAKTCSDCKLLPPVYLRDLEFRVTCATDNLGFRHSSISTKGKREVGRRALVIFVSVPVRVAF